MNPNNTFYTPGTGLPDFEMRIALGLCAAALNAVEPEKIRLVELYDRYCVEIDDDGDVTAKVMKALGWLCQNKISDQSLLLRIPGFRPLHLENQSVGIAKFGKKIANKNSKPKNIFTEKNEIRKGAHASACGHNYSRNDKITGALVSFCPQLGQPPKRDNVTHQITLPLCPFCVVSSLAGTFFFQIDVAINTSDRSKKERFFFLPHFAGIIKGGEMAQYIATAKHISRKIEDIPAPAALLALLSLYPHLIEILRDKVDSFFVGRLDSSGNAPRYEYQVEKSDPKEITFLKNAYNRALVQALLQERIFSQDRSKLLGLLARAFRNIDEKSALDFARTYVGVREGKALLSRKTTDSFAQEIFNMDKSLLEGENFDVIKKIADMLQYFVRERNFGYVDNLRKARDADEFAKLLLDAQREAQSAVLDPKKQYKPYLPGQNTVQQMLQLVNNEKQFRSVQTLVALLAFTYYKKED